MKIKHDIHVHTHLSKCSDDTTATLKNYIDEAINQGLSTLGISDHLWDTDVNYKLNSFYEGQDIDYVLQTKKELETIDRKGLNILFGCETEFAMGTLGLTKENASLFDYVLVPHSHYHMKGFVIPEDKITTEAIAQYSVDSFIEMVKKGIATSVAHPFEPCGWEKPEQLTEIFNYISDSKFRECFNTANEYNTGIEINTAIFCEKPIIDFEKTYLRMFKIAKNVGCKFSFGSDTHRIAKMKRIRVADDVIDYLNITEDDLIDILKY
ncbi:MAG: PHP domain-containing protein [Oscillospiraceae bacterium]